jgi:hypothetical protein
VHNKQSGNNEVYDAGDEQQKMRDDPARKPGEPRRESHGALLRL